MSQDDTVHDVIVVGAGISGLYTAKCLAEEGLDVVVLEARGRVGGRAWTLRDDRFGHVDMGGAYFGSAQTEVLALIKELDIDMYDLPTSGDSIIYFDKYKTRYREDAMPLSRVLALMDMNAMLNKLESYSKQVPTEKPWKAARALEWDNISVANFLDKECWTRLGCELTKAAFQTMYLTDPRQVSLLCSLWEIHNSGGVKFLFSSQELGAQAKKIKGGSNSISEKMAQILADRVKLNVVVRSVEQNDDDITLTTQDDVIYKTRKVVTALCPPLLKQIDMVPPLSPDQQCFVDHLPESASYKTMTFYDKPYWENKGFRGEFLCKKGIAIYGLPDTKPDGSHPAIMSFIDHKNGRHLTKEERKRALAAQYSDLFDCPELLHPCDYEEKYWGDEESKRYSGVCVYSLPPGLLTKHKSLWGRPHGSIFFAGVESSSVMHGYMDGGIRAGERAAKQVLDSLGVEPKRHYRTSQNPPKPLHRPLVERILPSVGQFYFVCAMIITIPVYLAMYCS